MNTSKFHYSLVLGRRTKGNVAWCFHSLLQVFERGFLQKISHFDEKEWPIKAMSITEPYRTYQKENEKVFNIITMIFKEHKFFKHRGFFTRPV